MVGLFSISGPYPVPSLFSSRHYPYIAISQGLSLALKGQEGHEQDITNYVNNELRIGQTALARKIKGDL
jgi:hypothetical protein